MSDSDTGTAKCPICNSNVPSVGVALSDPITDHFLSGTCTPEHYEFDVLDLSAFHPTNIFVLLEVLGRIPNLRHFWLRQPCPVSQRPAATVYERVTSMIYQETSLRKHAADSNFVARLGLAAGRGKQQEAESPRGVNPSANVNVIPADPTPEHSRKAKVGDSYEVIIRSENHVHIRNAILQVPFEELTEASHLLISFSKLRDVFDSTHDIAIRHILKQSGIFLSEGVLLNHLVHRKKTVLMHLAQNQERLVEPVRLTPEQTDTPFGTVATPGDEHQQSAILSTFSYEHTNDLSLNMNFCRTGSSYGRKVSVGHDLHRPVCLTDSNYNCSFSATKQLGSDRSTKSMGAFHEFSSEQQCNAFNAPNSVGAATNSVSSLGALGTLRTSVANIFEEPNFVSARAFVDSPIDDAYKRVNSDDNLLEEKEKELELELEHSPRDIELSAENARKPEDEEVQDSIVLKQSKSFFSHVIKSIMRQFRGEESTSKFSILNGLLESIRYDLPTIVLRRLMSLGSRKDYFPLLATLLPSLRSIDGTVIHPQKQDDYLREVTERYSFPHYLILKRLEGGMPPVKSAKTEKSGKAQTVTSNNRNAGNNFGGISSIGIGINMGAGGKADAHLGLCEIVTERRKRMSFKLQELEGQHFEHYCGSMPAPLDYPVCVSKRLCVWHMSRIIEPRSYSIFNAYPISCPTRLSTLAPELPSDSSFSPMSNFGRPTVLCSSPHSPDVAIGTDQGDVFVVDGSVPLCESMHRYVTVLDKYRRDYTVDVPFMRRTKIERHTQDSIVALTWLDAFPSTMVGATSYGELLFGTILYNYAHSATLRQRVRSHSIDVGCSIVDFSANTQMNEIYSVAMSGSLLRVLNYETCTRVHDFTAQEVLSSALSDDAPLLTRCCYSPSSSLLGLGTSSGEIVLHDTRAFGAGARPALTLNSFGGFPVESIRLGMEGNVVLAAALDGRVLHYDIRGTQRGCTTTTCNVSSLCSLSNHTKAIFTNKYKKFLVSQHDTGALKLFDYPSGKHFYELHMNSQLKRNTTNILDCDEVSGIPFTYVCITRANTIYDVSVVSLLNSSKDRIDQPIS